MKLGKQEIYAMITLVLVMTVSFEVPAFAVGSGGYENASFSANTLAQGNSVVARGEDASTISTNPAGILELPGLQIQQNIGAISLWTWIHAGQGNTRSSGTASIIPTTYVTINPAKYFSGRLALGFGVDSPFGLANKFDSQHPAVKYTGAKNWIKMYALKPTLALKVNEKVSIGGGPVYNNLFSVGAIQAYPNKLLGAGLPDGQVRLDTSGHGWGWQAGMLLKPHEKHHIGVYFRSPSEVLLKGQGKVENATVGGSFETGVHQKLTLPLNLTLGYVYYPNEKTEIEMDFGFTRWSVHDRANVVADSVDASNDAIFGAIGPVDKDWVNSYSLHLGGKYHLNDKVDLMAGGFFYSNVVPDLSYNPQINDSNSIAGTFGFNWDVTEKLEVSLAYMARFWLRRTVSNQVAAALGGNVNGKYLTYGQEIMLSFVYHWDDFLSPKQEKMRKKEDPIFFPIETPER